MNQHLKHVLAGLSRKKIFRNILLRLVTYLLSFGNKLRTKIRSFYLLITNDANLEVLLKYYSTQKMDLQYIGINPKISILIPVYNPPIMYLKECIQSVLIQTYKNWELCIVDDASPNPEVWAVLEEYKRQYPDKIKLASNSSNMHISETSNKCLSLSSGEYVALLDHDDRLYPNALGEVVRYIALYPDSDIYYSDEQTISGDGDPFPPFFKPGWSPELSLRVHYSTHLSIFRKSLLEKIGGFRDGFEGSQDHDLMLRATEKSQKLVTHIPMVLYQWRAHSQSTAFSIQSKPYAVTAGEKAVSEALIRRGRPATVNWDPQTLHYRIKYTLPEPQPLVSIIICSKDQPKLIKNCVKSIFTKSTYKNFEIILIDHQTTNPECLAFFNEIERNNPRYFKRIYFNGEFNFAAMNNLGTKESSGEYVILLNNDTVVITPEWIEEMVQLAQFPEVGAVGAKLLYPDGTIQHSGISLIDRDVAVNMNARLKLDKKVPCDLTNTVHETAAVTGACLCIKKDKYINLNGLTEQFIANGFGDVEFCIRLMKAGYNNLYTPHAVLYHFESQSRKYNLEFFEKQYLISQYGYELMNDPYLNPNIERDGGYRVKIESIKFQLTNEAFQYLLWTDPNCWGTKVS